MSNLKEVAQNAGVSMMTVSRVVNNKGYVKEETRQKVFKAIEDLNYYPNNLGRSLNKNRVNIIAVLAPLTGGAIENDPYFARLLYGIETYLVEYSYDLLLSTQRVKKVDGNYQFDYFRPYMERKADGLVLLGAKLKQEDLSYIEKSAIPFCVIGDRPDSPYVSVIDTNNRAGFRVMLEQIFARGHRKIAFAGYREDNFNILERHAGYLEFLQEMALPVRENYVIPWVPERNMGEIILEQWRTQNDRPTVIACATDDVAISVIVAAKAQGVQIPEDLSVTGFDGTRTGRLIDPPLMTMNQPLEEMGKKAAELILEKINHPDRSRDCRYFDVDFQPGKSLKSLQ